jgi:hypothetical protein
VIWLEFEDWTYEYFDRDIAPAGLPGFGWHGRLGLYEISYEPFDYTCRLSGTVVDGVFGRTMTGVKGSELAEMRVEYPVTMEFHEMACRQILIARTSGPLNLKGREHIQSTFVDFPLSDDGLRATHTFEAMLIPKVLNIDP